MCVYNHVYIYIRISVYIMCNEQHTKITKVASDAVVTNHLCTVNTVLGFAAAGMAL